MDYGLQHPEFSRAPVTHQNLLSDFYISVGTYPHDPGFGRVAVALQSVGKATHIHHSLWHLKSSASAVEVFRAINRSLVDRRIDGHTGVLILDTLRGDSQWHLPFSISSMLSRNWHQRTNLFISFTIENNNIRKQLLKLIDSLGAAACIDGSCWYVSSSYAVHEVFQLMAGLLGKKDELFFFDDQGHTAMCRYGHQVYPTFLKNDQQENRPKLGGRQLGLFE